MDCIHLSELIQAGECCQIHAGHSVKGECVDHLKDDVFSPGVQKFIEEDWETDPVDIQWENGEH